MKPDGSFVFVIRRRSGREYEIRIDADDIERVAGFEGTWVIGGKAHRPYVLAALSHGPGERKKYVYLHRFILRVDHPSNIVDHISGDTLDNRKANLRTTSFSINSLNRQMESQSRSGLRGVKLMPFGKWEARVMIDRRARILGYYTTKMEAAEAVRLALLDVGAYVGEDSGRRRTAREVGQESVKVTRKAKAPRFTGRLSGGNQGAFK